MSPTENRKLAVKRAVVERFTQELQGGQAVSDSRYDELASKVRYDARRTATAAEHKAFRKRLRTLGAFTGVKPTKR